MSTNQNSLIICTRTTLVFETEDGRDEVDRDELWWPWDHFTRNREFLDSREGQKQQTIDQAVPGLPPIRAGKYGGSEPVACSNREMTEQLPDDEDFICLSSDDDEDWGSDDEMSDDDTLDDRIAAVEAALLRFSSPPPTEDVDIYMEAPNEEKSDQICTRDVLSAGSQEEWLDPALRTIPAPLQTTLSHTSNPEEGRIRIQVHSQNYDRLSGGKRPREAGEEGTQGPPKKKKVAKRVRFTV
ncbi:hypothetical protein FN846DRAFT_910157 [Sphaerosporella brunnea]|uniref:Uncharacterized protein n=1 Tax=Sphaerosporella brunnea TaxID=1250544 RepID=A0A5J5ENQ9_9PEZI|nr:hypothetical protein FN846DRAFT_910157 [Sphaerosporella brunnea]